MEELCFILTASSLCSILWGTTTTTHHPWFLLFQQFDHVQMSLLFIVTVHIMFVPLVPLFGFLKIASFLLHNVLKRKAPTILKPPQKSNMKKS